MSKVIRISDEMYEALEETAFNNGVGIQHLADKVIEVGMECGKGGTLMVVEERSRQVVIKW